MKFTDETRQHATYALSDLNSAAGFLETALAAGENEDIADTLDRIVSDATSASERLTRCRDTLRGERLIERAIEELEMAAIVLAGAPYPHDEHHQDRYEVVKKYVDRALAALREEPVPWRRMGT